MKIKTKILDLLFQIYPDHNYSFYACNRDVVNDSEAKELTRLWREKAEYIKENYFNIEEDKRAQAIALQVVVQILKNSGEGGKVCMAEDIEETKEWKEIMK